MYLFHFQVSSLILKLVNQHTIRIMKCPKCDKTYKYPIHLENHLNKCQKQPQEKENQFKEMETIEDVLAKSKDEFVTPKPAKIARFAIEESSIQCHKCPKAFKDNDLLAQHIIFDHTSINCDLCEKEFSNFSSLKKHISDDHVKKV